MQDKCPLVLCTTLQLHPSLAKTNKKSFCLLLFVCLGFTHSSAQCYLTGSVLKITPKRLWDHRGCLGRPYARQGLYPLHYCSLFYPIMRLSLLLIQGVSVKLWLMTKTKQTKTDNVMDAHTKILSTQIVEKNY